MEEVNNETVLVSTQLTLTSSQLSPSNPLPLSLSVLKDSNIRAYKRRMAEMAEKFLEENIKNGLQPRIFPMESTFGYERVPTPFFYTSEASARISFGRKADGEKGKFDNNNFRLPPWLTATYVPAAPPPFDVQDFLERDAFGRNCNSRYCLAFPGFSVRMSSPAKRNSTRGGIRSDDHTMSSSRSDFATALKKWSASIPPVLSRKLGRVSDSPLGKVKVMLRVGESTEDPSGILGIDSRRKQVTLIDPGGIGSNAGVTPEERRVAVSAPKMFAFDGIFGDEDDQGEICAASAAELVASVVGGEDGCFLSLGSSTSGKKQTMFGKPVSQKMGVVPTTISWLFKSIQEQKQKAGSRFSVRISALTVTGGSGHEVINDLLLPFANDGDQPPGAYLSSSNGQGPSNSGNKFGKGSILSSVSEIRAASPEQAGFFFDTALESMKAEDPVRHFIFTIHVYQSSLDKAGKGVIGGRSRLHCVNLGNGSPSISVLGGLLLAVLNAQRHLPSRDSKLGAILRECLGSLTCRAVVMIHVSNAHSRYAETLAALQLGSRVHRLRRSRRLKMGSVGSGTGSGGSSGGSGEEMRPLQMTSGVGATICEGEPPANSDIDPSSSEQSCDTVIYLGPSLDDGTDGENPPIYLPPLDGDTGIETRIAPVKPPSHPSTIPPKTKSPKPKTTSKHLNSNFNSTKSEEQWVDGPKYSTPPSSNQKKKSETWIDGPAAKLIVNHREQAMNFPSPKKSIPPLQSIPSISSVKAQMIQQWISNQANSPSPFDEDHLVDSCMYLRQCSETTPHSCQYLSDIFQKNGRCNGRDGQEPEYKSLTVFKTCEDEEIFEEEIYGGNSGFEFEFIEVIEPEIPVPTRDACLQVTEEDIALSLLEENPLPESDQNFTMENTAYYFLSNALPPESLCSMGLNKSLGQVSEPDGPIQSSSSPVTSSTAPLTDKHEDHPLRVLSQECLTVVSTFTDSLSINGGELDPFWPRLSFAEQTNGALHYHHHNHGLCKNLASLSQMSLDAEETSNPPSCCLYTDNEDPGILSPLSTMRHNIKSSEIMSTGVIRPKTAVPAPPVLSDESIFKIPSGGRINGVAREKGSKESDAEQESVMIPPMKLLDLTPITSTVETVGLPPNPGTVVLDVGRGCDHDHHKISSQVSPGNRVNGTLPNGSMTSPSASDLLTKSPSKSRSRKIAKFFRGRSKSPKKTGSAASSSESGKSSGSSTVSGETQSSSSSVGSSYSSGNSPSNLTNNNHKSFKYHHPSPSPSKKSVCKVTLPTTTTPDYQLNCDSGLKDGDKGKK